MENESSTTQPNHPNDRQTIETGGGANVAGDVNLGQGDFIGRDKVIHGDEVQGDKVAGNKIIFTEEQAYNVYGLVNPYLGLRPFTYADRSIYAGREQLAQETVSGLTAPGAQQALLFITGASGSGKSSFAQAALIPLLETHYATYQKIVRYTVFRPSSQPLVMLHDALQKLYPGLTPETLATNTPQGQINLLLIDQFEELFIQSEIGQRAAFCAFLTNLPDFEYGYTHVLITLRVDYLDELFAIQPLWESAKQGVELRALSVDDLRSTIQKPLQVHYPQQRFAPEMLEQLVQDAGNDPTLLPLLQVTLVELWKTGKLILTNYHSLTDAIRQRAETVYAYSDHIVATPQRGRSQADRDEIMRILLDLINVAPDSTAYRDARQRRSRPELEQDVLERPALIEELINARLLAATSETRNGEMVEVIDIIHESLIDNWDRLRMAIEAQRQQLQQRARFKLWLGLWVQNSSDDKYLLLTDMQLAEARALAQAQDIELQNAIARDFYQCSLDHQTTIQQEELERVKELAEAQRQRAQTFRNAVIVAGLLFLVVALAASLSFYLNRQLNTANDALNAKNAQLGDTNTKLNTANNHLQTSLAETKRNAAIALSRQLAAQSTTELGNNHYELAILLAIESGKMADTLESFAAIRAAIASPWHSRIVFYGHMDTVNSAKWSKDESKLLTSSADHTVRIWDAATGKELVKLTEADSAEWNKDEGKLLTHSSDPSTVRIWDAATGKELVKLTGNINTVNFGEWNKDESKLLTRSSDGTVRIWDTATGKELVKLTGVWSAAWSKDGNKFLTDTDTVRIWDAATGKELVELTGVDTVLNKDGSKLLTHGADHTVRIWDATTGKELVKLTGLTDIVYSAEWSKDESKLLTHDADHTVRTWDATTGKELVKLTGLTDILIAFAEWSKDGSKLLIRGTDDTVHIWDTATGKELVKLNGVRSAEWSKDESKLMASGVDHTVRIWDAATGKELVKLTEPDIVNSVEWSKDGSKLMASGADHTVRIWDATTGKQLVKLTGHTNTVNSAEWNKDESKLLTSSADSTVRIWDTIMGQELIKLSGVNSTEWSKDGSKLLTHGADHSLRIWDAATGKELVKLNGVDSADGVSSVEWNKDESKLMTRGADHSVRI